MQKTKKKFQIGHFLFAALAFFSFTSLYAEEMHPGKQKIWDNMSYEVDHWIDGADHPMDEEIKEIVVALNILGIKTTASCEGHFDHGCLHPWVDFDVHSPETEKLRAELTKKFDEIEIEEKLLEAEYSDLSFKERLHLPEAESLISLYNDRFILFREYEQAQIKCLEPLHNLLNEFYETRNVSYDRILIISPVYLNKLQNVGADRQLIRSKEEQNFKLHEYRDEMKAFAAFLKRKFMDIEIIDSE